MTRQLILYRKLGFQSFNLLKKKIAQTSKIPSFSSKKIYFKSKNLPNKQNQICTTLKYDIFHNK